MKKASPTRLAAADLQGILLADRDIQLATLRVERDQARSALVDAQAELSRARAANALNVSATAAAQARAAHERLVADIQSRYAVDLKTTAFDPITGDLVVVDQGT